MVIFSSDLPSKKTKRAAKREPNSRVFSASFSLFFAPFRHFLRATPANTREGDTSAEKNKRANAHFGESKDESKERE